MAGSSLIVRIDALRSVAFGSITAAYTPLGAPFGHATRIVKIVNATNTSMLFSFNGSTDNEFIPAGGFVLYDLTTNGDSQLFVFQISTQVYVKYVSAPGSGAVYVSCVYGQGQ